MLSYASIAMVVLAIQGPQPGESTQTQLLLGEENAPPSIQIVSLPSDLVAARVRDVLRDNSDSEAWKQLADVLPEMALDGSADVDSTFEGSRLADSISSASSLAVDRASPLAMLRESLRWRPSWWNPRIETPPLVAVLLALILVSVVNWVWGARSNRQSLVDSSDPQTPSVNDRSDPWFVKSLAKSGRPVHEIARQTKMSQDAILVLLELQAGGIPQRMIPAREERWPHYAPPARKPASDVSAPALTPAMTVSATEAPVVPVAETEMDAVTGTSANTDVSYTRYSRASIGALG